MSITIRKNGEQYGDGIPVEHRFPWIGLWFPIETCKEGDEGTFWLQPFGDEPMIYFGKYNSWLQESAEVFYWTPRSLVNA